MDKTNKYNNKLIKNPDNKNIYYRKLYEHNGGAIPNFNKFISDLVRSNYLGEIINNNVLFIDNKKDYNKIINATKDCITVEDTDIHFDIDYIDDNFGYKCINKTKTTDLYIIKKIYLVN